MEKKSERLEVRLGHQEKQAFVEACDLQGDNPSGAVRRFINGYVKRSDGDVLSSAWRGSLKRRGWRPIIFIGIFLIIGTVFWGASHYEAQLSDEAIFSFRDRNGDNELDNSELGLPPQSEGSPNGVYRVLDLDASGTLSQSEFKAKGRMVYVVQNNPKAVIGKDGKTVPMTMVEFDISKDRSRIGIYQGAVINAGALDRLVVWYSDGSASVWQGHVDIRSRPELIIKADSVTFPSSMNIQHNDDNSVQIRRSE